jgi:hypothetical protein
MHPFMPVPTIPLAAMSDIGGRRYHRPLTVAALSAHTYSSHETVHTDLYVWGKNRPFSANVALFNTLNQSNCREKEGGPQAFSQP